MLKELKNTIRHTAIYGFGNVAVKLIGFVLMPLYTKHISVPEYGILGILEVTILILSQVLIFGQSQAFLRFSDLEQYRARRGSTLFTIFLLLFVVGLLFNVLGQSLAPKVSSLFFDPPKFLVYIRLCFCIVFLRVINNLYLSVLRARERSRLYAIANIVRLTVVLGLNVYFVAFARIGLRGILYSSLIGDCTLFFVLLPNVLPEMTPRFDLKILTASLTFGFPLIFVALAGMLLNTGDRYILKLLSNYREVGLYDLGCRIAGVLNVFLIQSFLLGLLPIAYRMYGKSGDRRYYSKILTYFVFVLSWVGLGIALFSREVVETLAQNSDYWGAYHIVPYIVLGYVFTGTRAVGNLGLYLTNRTKYIAYNTVASVILNIGLNLLLIPDYGVVGASISRIVSLFVLYAITYSVANRFYPIPYEHLKVWKMLVLATVLFLLSTLFVDFGVWPRILLKLGLLVSFPFLLYPMNFYEKIEIERVTEGVGKIVQVLVNMKQKILSSRNRHYQIQEEDDLCKHQHS